MNNGSNDTNINGAMLTTSIPVAFVRAAMAAVATWGALTIAIFWSAKWTLVYAADISGHKPNLSGEITAEMFGAIPVEAKALTALIFLAPALLMSWAALPSTPVIVARIIMVSSAVMSLFDIATTYVGYQVIERVQSEGASTADGFLVSFGLVMVSILASFADEAALVFFSLSMLYFREAILRWKRVDIDIFRGWNVLPTVSGLARVWGGTDLPADGGGASGNADSRGNGNGGGNSGRSSNSDRGDRGRGSNN